jgi:hypothetical protein
VIRFIPVFKNIRYLVSSLKNVTPKETDAEICTPSCRERCDLISLLDFLKKGKQCCKWRNTFVAMSEKCITREWFGAHGLGY